MKINLFKALSSRDKKSVEMHSNEIFFDKEESIIKNNSALHSVYFIEKGMVKYKDINQKTYFLIGENEFVGLSTIFNEKKKQYNAYVTSGSKIIQIEKTVLKKILRTNPDFMELIIRYNGERSLFLTEHLSFRNRHINSALAYFLLMYNEKKCLHNLTRKEIGEIIGFSRENVSKSFKTFITDKIIREGQSIEILNEEGLKEIKKFG